MPSLATFGRDPLKPHLYRRCVIKIGAKNRVGLQASQQGSGAGNGRFWKILDIHPFIYVHFKRKFPLPGMGLVGFKEQ
jgi:hypothetical protein